MPRANRYFLSGHVWHITHRCHKKEFLLKFARDRQRWRYWLYQARKRFGLCVLNYIVTSNHIHLLVRDRGEGEIAKSMQLTAGRTAQEYNQRKGRKGAFWEDRYHATAVDTEGYLSRCMVYIDLNMVRAGVVKHPGGWSISGYHEIQNPSTRYTVIDQPALLEVFEIRNIDQLQKVCRDWVDEDLRSKQQTRNGNWSTSLAVGRPEFIDIFKTELGLVGMHRGSAEFGSAHVLREPAASYSPHFEGEMARLRGENTIILD